MQFKKGLIFEILCIAIIFTIVPIFYKNINADFSTYKNLSEMKKITSTIMTGFTITAYCPGSCCNDKWAGMTASGKSMTYYIDKGINIIAVDPILFTLGTKIIYDNIEYKAVDTGKKIKGKRLDILLLTHKETETFGIKRNQTIELLN